MRSIFCMIGMGLGLVACGGDDGIDATRLAYRLRPPTDGSTPIVWSRASLDVRAWRLRPCEGDEVASSWPGVAADKTTWPELEYPRPYTVGFEGPKSSLLPTTLPLPLGTWCGFDLVMRGPALFEGQAESTGATISMTIDMPNLTLPFAVPFADLATEVATDGTGRTRQVVYPLILEFGTSFWTFGIEEDVAGGGEVVVEPGDTAHDLVRGALLVGLALYRDIDGDGVLSDEERSAQRLAGLVPL